MLKNDRAANLKTASPNGGRSGSWLRRALYAPRPPQAEHAGMSLSLEIQLEQGPVWLAAQGTSMLRLPGCEVKIERLETAPEVGMVLVFRHGARLYSHRVIERISPDQWRTKGDTLLEPDELVSHGEVSGQVTALRLGRWEQEVRPDAGAAWLSQRLGRFFFRPGQSAGGLRRILYLAALLSAWPFRRLLARRYLESGAPTPQPAMRKD